MNTITSISDYCREINVPPPRHNFFDSRRFDRAQHSLAELPETRIFKLTRHAQPHLLLIASTISN
jgi:hypothetical protein